MSKRVRRPTRRVPPFLFFGTPDRGRQHRPYHARDQLCVLPLLEALARQGHGPGAVILNMPPQDGEPLAPIPLRLGERDTLLVVTRLARDWRAEVVLRVRGSS